MCCSNPPTVWGASYPYFRCVTFDASRPRQKLTGICIPEDEHKESEGRSKLTKLAQGHQVILCSLINCSHRRHGQDKTVLSCFFRVGGVNNIGDKTRQDSFVLSTQFPICNYSVSVANLHTGYALVAVLAIRGPHRLNWTVDTALTSRGTWLVIVRDGTALRPTAGQADQWVSESQIYWGLLKT